MYSPKVTQARIAAASEQLGCELHYHTVAQVETARSYLDLLYDREQKTTIRPLRPAEVTWIKNERILCACDFRYYATRYCFIRDISGEVRRFDPWVSQRIMLDIWSEMEEEGIAINIQQLKARQLGCSLLTELAVAHRVQFYPDVNALVASSDPEKSAKMAQMMERAWENMPWFLMPGIKTWRTGTLIEFNNGSIVSIQHGTQKSGIGRGDTPTISHLSELPDYENPGELVDASLLRAMHDTPQKFLILEATAKGIHNWWHDTWNSNKLRWARRESSLRPVFLPYFVGSDVYPTDTWLKAHPIPPDWKPSAVALKHEERANAYVQVNDLLRKHLGADWRLPQRQLWWWELTREQYKEKNELAQFYSETPADDVDAFQSQCYPAFDAEIIAEYHGDTKHPKAVFGFVGASVPMRIQPDRREIDPSMPPIPIRRILPNGARFECDLVPLRFSGYPGYDWTNKLFVWEFAEKGAEYGLGVDTGEGVGLDSSVIEIFRKQDFNRRDCQVAEFASPYANSYDLPPLVFSLSALYSLVVDSEPRDPKIVVECNSSGKATQLELRKMGCSNFHIWLGSYDTRKIRPAKATKIGWWTKQWSRDLMKDFFVKRLRDNWVEIRSPYFVEEMRDLERDDIRQRISAMHGGHDDRFMASGFVLFSLHALSLGGTQRGNSWQAEPPSSEPEYPLYRPERFVNPGEFEGETPESAYPAESLEVYRGY